MTVEKLRPNHSGYLAAAICGALALISADAAVANTWASVDGPTRQAPHAIGQTSHGCLAGATSLPIDGKGYLVMHLERHRYYGHPSLVRAIQSLGVQASQHAIGVLQIGDLSQARGGPMPSGHRSHQNGLDADIWFNLDPGLYARTDALRANIGALSLLNLTRKGLDRKVWSDRHVTLLQLAAQVTGVDRIFVNPYIKRELCATVKGSRNWLRKLRPWYGHDDHFHIRLVCPPDSPDCDVQEDVPAGEGCDASLDWWFEPHPPGPPPPPKPPLPAQCSTVLAAP